MGRSRGVTQPVADWLIDVVGGQDPPPLPHRPRRPPARAPSTPVALVRGQCYLIQITLYSHYIDSNPKIISPNHGHVVLPRCAVPKDGPERRQPQRRGLLCASGVWLRVRAPRRTDETRCDRKGGFRTEAAPAMSAERASIRSEGPQQFVKAGCSTRHSAHVPLLQFAESRGATQQLLSRGTRKSRVASKRL